MEIIAHTNPPNLCNTNHTEVVRALGETTLVTSRWGRDRPDLVLACFSSKFGVVLSKIAEFGAGFQLPQGFHWSSSPSAHLGLMATTFHDYADCAV